jgi:menaquinone-dependent protoporphyrinogen oxidase
MNVLVLFSSTEGQTRKVAEHVALQAKSAGHGAVVYDMGSDRSIPSIDAFDTVVCAASVHQGYHQESAIDFVAAQAKALNAKKSAFISVSLSAAMEDGRAEAQAYVDRFLEATGWKPAECLLLGGAIRLSSYDYF